MDSVSFIQKLNQIAKECEASVGYKPLIDDADYTSIPVLKNIFRNMIFVPNDKNSDPHVWADICEKHSGGRITCILIPGRKFDLSGTRHGRGGGWYDRFLSKVPKDWIRIGIADRSIVSSSPIKRESWDQQIDWIIYSEGSSWQIYETHARKNNST